MRFFINGKNFITGFDQVKTIDHPIYDSLVDIHQRVTVYINQPETFFSVFHYMAYQVTAGIKQ